MKNLISISAIVIVSILLGALIFTTCNKQNFTVPIAEQQLKQITKEVEFRSKTDSITIAQLKNKNDDLKFYAKNLNDKLSKADNIIYQTKIALRNAMNSLPTGTETELANNQEVLFEQENLITAFDNRDSLKDVKIETLEKIIVVNDSIIISKDSTIKFLKQKTDSCLNNEQKLIDFANKISNKAKGQKIWSNVKAGIAFLLGRFSKK